MDLVVGIKRLIKKNKEPIEVWDISAVRNWLERIQARLEAGNVVIIIPEIVMRQLSESAKPCEVNTYNYLLGYTGDKLNYAVTDSDKRDLSYYEQIFSIFRNYYNQGYDVTLVTCDANQSHMAEQLKLSCMLFPGNKNKSEFQKNEQKVRNTKMSKTKTNCACDPNETEKRLKNKKIGKDNHIVTRAGIEVYDNRGKRRIGKNSLVKVQLTERVVYDNVEYIVTTITDTDVILKRI